VLLGGSVFTMNPQRPWAEALAITGNSFCFVGSEEGARQLIASGTDVIDLDGQFVLPGFNDAHLHFQPDMLPSLREMGITTAQTISHPNDLPQYLDLAGRGELTIRLEVRLPLETWEKFPTHKKSADQTHGLVSVNGLKGHIDGMFRNRTAFLLAPYSGYSSDCGSLSAMASNETDFWRLLEGAASVGADISMHAIGDAGVRALLDHYEALIKKTSCRPPRLRVVHAALLSPTDFRRFGELGLIAEVNPYHAQALRWLKTVIGEARTRWAFAFRSLKTHGAMLCFGSDHPGPSKKTEFPLNPLFGIQAAVLHENPDERLSLKEALEAYTVSPAHASGERESKGTIEVGKLADVAVLRTSPFEVAVDQIQSIRVTLTILNGKVVFSRSRCG
jgi:hypothetical protein